MASSSTFARSLRSAIVRLTRSNCRLLRVVRPRWRTTRSSLHRSWLDGAHLPQFSRLEISVGAPVRVALQHALAGCGDHFWIQPWILALVSSKTQAALHRMNGGSIEAKLQVQAIEQWAREPLPIPPTLAGAAMAGVFRISKPTAGTGIGCSDQRDCTGIVVADAAAPKPNDPVLQGLTQ